jgi:regulator of sirC expression with transglutaminase-like and TPR domain
MIWRHRWRKERARLFLELFNGELGFRGNREHYYAADNSFLNCVLERRVGLPIMLSLLCMVLGQRMGLDIVGIGFPGHFMARYRDALGTWLLDPFNGQVLDADQATAYLAGILGQSITLSPDAYEAVSPVALAHRILLNLRNVYLGNRDHLSAVRVADYLLVLTPENPALWQERGLLHYYTENWEAAAHDLRRYFFLAGCLWLALGHQPNGDAVAASLDPQTQQLIGLYRQIEETRRRIN